MLSVIRNILSALTKSMTCIILPTAVLFSVDLGVIYKRWHAPVSVAHLRGLFAVTIFGFIVTLFANAVACEIFHPQKALITVACLRL